MKNRMDMDREILELFSQLAEDEKKDFMEVAAAICDDHDRGVQMMHDRMDEKEAR